MKKTEAIRQAKSEVIMVRAGGAWAVCLKDRVHLNLSLKLARSYQRELVIERALVYMGYSMGRVYSLPADVYEGEERQAMANAEAILEEAM
jgi:hypothetical protein